MRTIDLSARTDADPATVYAVLLDGERWPEWTPIDAVALEPPAGPGAPPAQGVGDVRVLRIGRFPSRQRVVALRPDARFEYAEPGPAFREYRASVDLTPEPAGGTAIRWHAAFAPRVPGTGWLLERVTRRFLGQMLAGLTAHAARLSAARR
jgi:hypothetical protein